MSCRSGARSVSFTVTAVDPIRSASLQFELLPIPSPIHREIYGSTLWMAATEVTQRQWTAVMGSNPSSPRSKFGGYAGVLAGNAALRAEVVPKVPTSTEAEREARAALKRVKAESRRETTARAEERRCWAELLKRVFEVDGWACPHCNKPMKLRSIVIREPATTQVVSGLLRATGPPAAA